MLMFVPGLYLFSPAYRSGYGFSTHVAALMLFPPLVILALRGTRYMLLQFYVPLRLHARKIAWGLTLFAIAAGVGYLFYQSHTFETTAFAFQESPLMKDMTELADPHFGFWTGRYGTIFLLGSLGIILAAITLHKWNGLPLTLALTLFTATTFFREPISRWLGTTFFGEQVQSWASLISFQETTSELTGMDVCDILFLISFGLTAISLAITCLRKQYTKNELVLLAMLSWFLLWVALSRGGKRYDLFIGIPLAYGTAWLLYTLPTSVIQKLVLTDTVGAMGTHCFRNRCTHSRSFFESLRRTCHSRHCRRREMAETRCREHRTPLAKTLKFLNTVVPREHRCR